jgi:hypothetical protein
MTQTHSSFRVLLIGDWRSVVRHLLGQPRAGDPICRVLNMELLLQCLERQEIRRRRHYSAHESPMRVRATNRNSQAHSRESGHFSFS